VREITKSSLSAGLAMSVFGLQQFMNLCRPRRSNGASTAAESLNSVAQAMVDQSSDALRETFHASDKIQRGLVDMTFRLLALEPLRSPGAASTISGAARQTTEQIRRWMEGMGVATGGGCGCRGDRGPNDRRTGTVWAAGAGAGPSERDRDTAWRQGDVFAARAEPRQSPEPDAEGWGPVPPEM